MSWRRGAIAALDDLSTAGLVQRGLRVLAILAAATAWLAGTLAGAGDSPVAFTVLLVAAAWCAIAPDSQVGLLVPLALGWQWVAHLDRTTTGWVLLAAGGLLVFHAATALAASAPVAAAPGRTLVGAAARRTGSVGLVTAGVWVAVRWSPATGRPGHLALVVAALLVLALAAWGAATVLRSGSQAG